MPDEETRNQLLRSLPRATGTNKYHGVPAGSISEGLLALAGGLSGFPFILLAAQMAPRRLSFSFSVRCSLLASLASYS